MWKAQIEKNIFPSNSWKGEIKWINQKIKLEKLVRTPNVVVRLTDGDLHAVGRGEGPLALWTPIKPATTGVGRLKKAKKSKFKIWQILFLTLG